MGRADYVGIVSQLLHGEIAAEALCARLLGRLPPGPQRRFLATQAADEARHRVLYTAYLARLGDIVPADDGSAPGSPRHSPGTAIRRPSSSRSMSCSRARR
ncbi:MAG: ferritin-like domain-containing protein [Alphaproteobacteria bacterium]|nr:ferritin-like domain-containing protein [Alphaproteobacteria bacterium]